ncbi:MAG: HTTM domain-containing protein [Planctomycetales bacterium]|nr:HTTM domain-containing protein [Planctomycetales bacterium]
MFELGQCGLLMFTRGSYVLSFNESSQNAAPSRMPLVSLLVTSVDGASLAVFRICVGILMALEGWSLLVPHDAAITAGTPLENYYTGSDIRFHWPYEGFEWLPLFSPTAIYAMAILLCVAGISMAFGLMYRISSVLVFLIWGYLFAVESTRTYWQSHFYLELLTCFLLAWMPAANRFSLDAWLKRTRTSSVPFWTLFVLRGQLVIAYFYAGIAKLHYDWLLDAVPVRWFLADKNTTAPYEAILSSGQLAALQDFLHLPELAYALAWIGTIFDLAVGFLLLIRRTRIFGLILMLIFHSINFLFLFDDIGWFPILGITTVTIFLDPDWPERLLHWLRNPAVRKPDMKWAAIGGIIFPVVGASLGWSLPRTDAKNQVEAVGRRASQWVVASVMLWLVWQSVLPVRHHLINSDSRFTYEGFSFSWRLKADTRHAVGHQIRIEDADVMSAASETPSVHWQNWPFEKQLFRKISPGQVLWPEMPEFSVVLEPILGERIIYNPYSGRQVSYADNVAAIRANGVWRDLYQREPELLVPLSISQAIDQIVAECRSVHSPNTAVSSLASLRSGVVNFERGIANSKDAVVTLHHVQLQIRELTADPELQEIVGPIVRRIYPFALQGEPARPAAFFIVEDSQVLSLQPNGSTRIEPTAFVHGPSTRPPGVADLDSQIPDPIVIHFGPLGAETKDLLPLAYIADSQTDNNQAARIHWNSLQDMTMSKYMHSSAQPFYLRRYARRVAAIWEQQSGRRPKVSAVTLVSYNGRPHQELVDPQVNLAEVPVHWFRHNAWIRDLQMKRIPHAAVNSQPKGYSVDRRTE